MKNAFTFNRKMILKSACFFLLILVAINYSKAQMPQYYNYNTPGSANSIPTNIPFGKDVQLLYLPGDFTQPTPAPLGVVTSIYLRINESYPLGPFTYTDFTVKMGQSSITTFTAGSFYTGPLTTVYYRASVTLTGTAGGWISFPLDSSFTYDPGQSLIVEVGQCGVPGATGYSMCYTAISDLRRNWSLGGCPFAYSNGDASVYHIGMDICIPPTPPANTTPLANQTICSGSSTILSASGTGTLGWYSAAIGGTYLGSGANYSTPALTTNTTYYVQDSTCTVSLSRTPIAVTVNPVFAFTENHSICDGEIYNWHGSDYNMAGTFYDSLQTINGCDSIYTLNLTVNSVDTSLTVSDPTITTNAVGASYQWIDCDNAYAIIPGAVSQSYTAVANGNYAVIVTQGLCSDTSACVPIITIGISSIQLGEVAIYPNPTTGKFVIRNENIDWRKIEIYNILGERIFADTYKQQAEIDFTNQPDGIYLIKAVDKKGVEYSSKFIKE